MGIQHGSASNTKKNSDPVDTPGRFLCLYLIGATPADPPGTGVCVFFFFPNFALVFCRADFSIPLVYQTSGHLARLGALN